MTAIEQLQSGSEGADTIRDYLSEWQSLYPSISALLRDLECPKVLDSLARTSQTSQVFRAWLRQWKQLGRPELEWPKSKAKAQLPLSNCISQSSNPLSHPFENNSN
jgi:hypothetical protein